MRTGGVHLLVVARDEQNDSLIPLVGAIVIKLDPAKQLIVIDPPEGLLEL
jgi:ribosomal 30S subunit maturation factor RimM